MTKRRVVFVCLHGSAKSVIAASYCRRLADRYGVPVDVESAGVEPDASIPPKVVGGLGMDGIDVSSVTPRAAAAVDFSGATRVIAFGCDVPGVPAGVPVEQWSDVPAVSEDFGRARDLIVARVDRLVADLEGAG
ncbi:MAG: hypothetical protein HYU41_25775 [Candidatus Rokubacteria bacterium]|nr:hypothetical protein [Candidatus Rokubacteria bacterium]